MTYEWKCLDFNCSHITEVQRKMADYEIPPEGGCEKCGKTAQQRVITRWQKQQHFKVWGGKVPWHDEAYSARGRIRDK